MKDFIPNSFQVPNKLVDDVIAHISPNALKCYLVIVRKTVGWQKEWDKIPTTQLKEFTGIKKNDTVYKATAELEKLQLIETLKETGKTTEYRLKVVPEKVVPINGTSPVQETKPVPKKGSTTSPVYGDTSKDNTKDIIQNIKNTKKDFETFTDLLEANVKIKSKVTNTKEGLELFKTIEDKWKLFEDYQKHQETKGEYAARITAFMKDYEFYKNQSKGTFNIDEKKYTDPSEEF